MKGSGITLPDPLQILTQSLTHSLVSGTFFRGKFSRHFRDVPLDVSIREDRGERAIPFLSIQVSGEPFQCLPFALGGFLACARLEDVPEGIADPPPAAFLGASIDPVSVVQFRKVDFDFHVSNILSDDLECKGLLRLCIL